MERFTLQVSEAESLKSGSGALAATMIDVSSVAPPMLHSALARPMYATRLFNLTITNVPGPPAAAVRPRLADARVADRAAGGRARDRARCWSYDGELFFTFNADRDAVPDLDVALEGIEESLAELHALSARAKVEAECFRFASTDGAARGRDRRRDALDRGLEEGRHAHVLDLRLERNGAPVTSFCRIDEAPIRSREPTPSPTP